ncbi:biotin transporter BioY, partial [Aerococcus sp. L_32]
MTKSSTYYWVLSALMSVITLIASYVVVPFGAIPFTLQTLAVILTGLLLPRKYAAVAMLLNAILLFMFKGAFIYSPSFGFIIGFIVAMIFASQNPALENGWKVLTIRAIGMNIIIF